MEISINTSQHVAIEYTVASVWERAVAFKIDLSIQVGWYFMVDLLLGSLRVSSTALEMLFALLPFLLYDLVSEFFFEGQSVGKKAMHIQVISLSGKQPSMGQYLIRWILRPIDFLVSMCTIAVITVFITGTGQRLGDFIAGTSVIKNRRKLNFSPILFPEFEAGYTPAYPEAIKLTDHDVNVIKEVIRTYSRNHDSDLLKMMIARIKDVLGIEPKQQTNLQFLRSLVKDHHHIHGGA